jgi:putative membrane protein
LTFGPFDMLLLRPGWRGEVVEPEVGMVMRNWDGGIGWGGWLAMVAMMVAFWGALAWVVVTLLRHTGTAGSGGGPVPRSPDARQVLDERYARGEIDDDEYRRRRDVLRGGS